MVSSAMLYPRDKSMSLPKYGRFSARQGTLAISNARVINLKK